MGLKHLSARDRRLIVGRAELGYNYEQRAFIERLPSPEAARMALQRALVRLSGIMSNAWQPVARPRVAPRPVRRPADKA